MSSPGAVIIARALVSVSDKTGLVELGRFLAERKVEILSTGGTASALRSAGVAVRDVSSHTGFPEILGGRVKTLHPLIHGGVLARRDDPGQREAMARHGILPIDLVVVNLYPFERTAASGAVLEDCIETIDVGGPALVRAAAKNHEFVTVVVDPADYGPVMSEMAAQGGATTLALRRRLAAEAFARVAAYDAAIAARLDLERGERFPRRLVGAGELRQRLRYGENPHQEAALYVGGPPRPGAASARQVQGKELSYNNIADADAAFELAIEFDAPAAAIIKHETPSGVALSATLVEAYVKARDADPVSAFGGVVGLNRAIDRATAERLGELFLEVVIAPDADAEALAALAGRKNLRLLLVGAAPDRAARSLVARSVAGGFLVQERDHGQARPAAERVVTRRQPTAAECFDLSFAEKVAKHAKSNAIVLAKDGRTVGIGAGQMSRVDAARLAVLKASDMAEAAGEPASRAVGAVAASDAFFPFADGLTALAEAGIAAVIQPGGSVRDDEVIAAADARGLAMLFTGVRHFRH